MSEETLSRVRTAASYGQLVLTRHGLEQMNDRNVSAEEVINAIKASTSCEVQEDGKLRLEGGEDCDGIALVVVVAEDPRGLRLVTVF